MTQEQHPVGVVIEIREPVTPWGERQYVAVAVLPGDPEARPWTPLGAGERGERVFLGATAVEFHRSSTTEYLQNLAYDQPKVWVVLRPTGLEPPVELFAATVDPAEGEAHVESTANVVEAVPMPADLAARLAAFCAAHHTERVFIKRKRDRAGEGSAG